MHSRWRLWGERERESLDPLSVGVDKKKERKGGVGGWVRFEAQNLKLLNINDPLLMALAKFHFDGLLITMKDKVQMCRRLLYLVVVELKRRSL